MRELWKYNETSFEDCPSRVATDVMTFCAGVRCLRGDIEPDKLKEVLSDVHHLPKLVERCGAPECVPMIEALTKALHDQLRRLWKAQQHDGVWLINEERLEDQAGWDDDDTKRPGREANKAKALAQGLLLALQTALTCGFHLENPEWADLPPADRQLMERGARAKEAREKAEAQAEAEAAEAEAIRVERLLNA